MEWLRKDATNRRHDKLLGGYGHWCKRFSGTPPGTPYILLHSLSHALMSEIALDCGYPASSLKDRVYALPGVGASGSRALPVRICLIWIIAQFHSAERVTRSP